VISCTEFIAAALLIIREFSFRRIAIQQIDVSVFNNIPISNVICFENGAFLNTFNTIEKP